MDQNFTADAIDRKWVSDITYILTEEGWLYFAVVLEFYSRRVIWLGYISPEAFEVKKVA